MAITDWAGRWRALEAACAQRRLVSPMRCRVGPPADERSIAKVEKRLGAALPGSLRRVVSTYSASVDIWWQLDEPVPEEFSGIFGGEIHWELSEFPKLSAGHAGWIRECFGDPGNAYDAVWHAKFPFLSVANGDMLAIETGPERTGAVVYLSHDDGEGHGFLLGNDFEDYVERISRLGGVGAEDWQWVRFTSSSVSGIDPASQLAERWRTWFGLGTI